MAEVRGQPSDANHADAGPPHLTTMPPDTKGLPAAEWDPDPDWNGPRKKRRTYGNRDTAGMGNPKRRPDRSRDSG